MEQGLIHIYTGDGKGKTTAAAGLAVRAVSSGLRVGFYQFMKSGDSAELKGLETLGVRVVSPQGGDKFLWQMNAEETEGYRALQKQCLAEARARLLEYDLLVLDEAISAANTGMVDLEDLERLVETKPEGLELVLTGRDAPRSLTRAAQYVTNMKCDRHPFDLGIPAREGIEY